MRTDYISYDIIEIFISNFVAPDTLKLIRKVKCPDIINVVKRKCKFIIIMTLAMYVHTLMMSNFGVRPVCGTG